MRERGEPPRGKAAKFFYETPWRHKISNVNIQPRLEGPQAAIGLVFDVGEIGMAVIEEGAQAEHGTVGGELSDGADGLAVAEALIHAGGDRLRKLAAGKAQGTVRNHLEGLVITQASGNGTQAGHVQLVLAVQSTGGGSS